MELAWPTIGLLVAYSMAIVLASIFGGMLPEWIRLTHLRMQLMISCVGGIMLGIAVFHMIPHALVVQGAPIDGSDIDRVAWGVMLGLIATFFLLRFFHFHQHGPADFGIQAEEDKARQAAEKNGDSDPPIEHTHICSDHNHPSHSHSHSHSGTTRWMGVLMGLALHTLTDGVALASGVMAGAGHDHGFSLPGLGIFLAVLLHKPLDAVSITSLMHSVTTPNKRLLVNVGFALMCPVGAFAFLFGVGGTPLSSTIAAWGLAFSAGVFLCISLSDLLPEMEFHSHSRIQLSAALLLGILAAWLIGLAEGPGAHDSRPNDNSHTAGETQMAQPPERETPDES